MPALLNLRSLRVTVNRGLTGYPIGNAQPSGKFSRIYSSTTNCRNLWPAMACRDQIIGLIHDAPPSGFPSAEKYPISEGILVFFIQILMRLRSFQKQKSYTFTKLWAVLSRCIKPGPFSCLGVLASSSCRVFSPSVNFAFSWLRILILVGHRFPESIAGYARTRRG